VQEPCRTIDPDGQGFAIECHEHESDAVERLQMCRRFVTATCQIEPDNPLRRENAQAVETLGRHVDAPVCSSRGNKEHFLLLDEIGEALIECGEWIGHGFLGLCETDCTNPTDKGLQAAAKRVTAKIADVLPDPRGADMADGRFVVSRFGAPEPMAADMGMLRAAVRDDRQLAIDYRDEQGDATHRTVLPLAVIYYTEVTVLAAWCELRKGYRHFRADRIVACRETGETFIDQAVKLRQDWHEQLIMPHDALP
jgi:hypothetical protein